MPPGGDLRGATCGGPGGNGPARRGLLPRGRADLVVQIAVWCGWVVAYEATRGLVVGGRAEALANARFVLRLERGLGTLFEPALQRAALDVPGLIRLVNWTYWLSQLVVVLLAVAWIYLRRYEAYARVRNTLIATNTVGLLGYALIPLAPPRMLPGEGFVDTLATSEIVNQGSGLIRVLANPYAAMPSLHAADALIVGLALAAVSRRLSLRVAFLLWPVWVAFALVASGNHFWVDVAAGFALALASGWLTGVAAARRAGARGAG